MRAKLAPLLMAAMLVVFALPVSAAQNDAAHPAARQAAPSKSTPRILFRIVGPVPADAAFVAASGSSAAYICAPAWESPGTGTCEARTYVLWDEPLPVGERLTIHISRSWLEREADGGTREVRSLRLFDIDIVVGEADQTYTYTYDLRPPVTLPDTAVDAPG